MSPVFAVLVVAIVTGIIFLTVRWQATYHLPVEPAWLREARGRDLKRRMPKWVPVFVLSGWVIFFAGLGMFFSAFSSNPQHPESASGHVYELDNHGSYVYVTKADYIRIFGMMVGGWSVGAASIMVGYAIAQRRRAVKREQPRVM
jgi:hypothetical protein